MGANRWSTVTATGAQPWIRRRRGDCSIGLVNVDATGIAANLERSYSEDGSDLEVIAIFTDTLDPPQVMEITEENEWLRLNVTAVIGGGFRYRIGQ